MMLKHDIESGRALDERLVIAVGKVQYDNKAFMTSAQYLIFCEIYIM